jgi:hypothetical protein
MSNRSGDLYRCSDPDCGCEVELRRPSEAVGASSSATQGGSGSRTMEIHDGLEKADSHMDMTFIRADEAHLPPPVSGNGLEESRTSAGTKRTSEPRSRHGASGRESLRCFCGAEMRDTGTTVRNARVATMKL